MFGIGSAGMRTKMRRSSSIIIMNMVTSNKKIQKQAVAVTDDNLKTQIVQHRTNKCYIYPKSSNGEIMVQSARESLNL